MMTMLKQKREISARSRNVADKIITFMKTEDGQEIVRKAIKNAKKTNDILNKAARINPEDLHKPFTI